MTTSDATIDQERQHFLKGLWRRNPHEQEFHQAVDEVVTSLMPFVLDNNIYRKHNILERLTEPDRIISFRVCWEDDAGNIRTNRGWRVQFSNAIGPYKGGLRFHPSVTRSVLKFLGFEQIFKNSLTGLPMGGAKGGSNFNPKGKSDREVMRFCQSFMVELHRHIGEDIDVPAGDIGVGAREIGCLFGMYKRLENRFAGVLTGKGLQYGGSLVRKQATGYGVVFFMQEMLAQRGEGLEGKTALVSGSGNVALYCIEKLTSFGVKVLTASDSGGFIHDPDGINKEKLAWLIDLKENRRGRISEYAEQFSSATYTAEAKPWGVAADLAFPCATQNEITEDNAETLINNGIFAVAEGANMPSTNEALTRFIQAKVAFAPGKASNAGGVAVSGLEQSQNALRISWSHNEVETRLEGIMKDIHKRCLEHGTQPDGFIHYVNGANIGGFIKVADAMLAYGIV